MKKILGKSFLKKNFTFYLILNLKLNFKNKIFFTNLYKKTNCKKPAIETP